MLQSGTIAQQLRINLVYWLLVLLVNTGSLLLETLAFADPWPQRKLWIALALCLGQALLTSALLWHTKLRQYSSRRFLLTTLLVALLFIIGSNLTLQLLVNPGQLVLTALFSQLDLQLLAFFVWASICLISQRSTQLRQQAAQADAMTLQLQQLELQSLQQQLNPHFTFNALNSLVGLLESRHFAAAEQMTEQLATFLRYSMNQPANALVPLTTELAAMREYLALQQIRFGNRLRLHWHISASTDTLQVPALILQPLLENAIKYAVAPAKKGADIWVRCDAEPTQLRLAVTDNGAGLPVNEAPGQGVGLANVQARLQQHFGAAAGLSSRHLSSGFQAQIHIPLPEAGDPLSSAELGSPDAAKARADDVR